MTVTNASDYIGHVNPGFGYWWVQTTNGFELWLPAPVQVSVFWPVFIVTSVVGVLLVCSLGGLWSGLKKRGRLENGASDRT